MKKDTRTFLATVVGVPLALTGAWGIHEVAFATLPEETPTMVVAQSFPVIATTTTSAATSTTKKTVAKRTIPVTTPPPVAVAPAPVVVTVTQPAPVEPSPVVKIIRKSRSTRAS